MDLGRLEQGLRHKMHAVHTRFHRERDLTEEAFRAEKARVQRLLAAVRSRREARRAAERAAASRRGALGRLAAQGEAARALLASGARVAAIDVECTIEPPGRICEIGLTRLTAAGLASHNVVITDAPAGRRLTGAPVGFDFGDAAAMPLAAAVAWLARELEAADVLVGHELPADAAYLRGAIDLSAWRSFDTVLLGAWRLGGGKPSLTTLAAALGVAAPNPHSAGNDSRYTLECFLRLVAAPG